MRVKIFKGIIVFFFSVLVASLFYIQIVEYGLYKGLSERNRIRAIPLQAPRGKIYDRNGRLAVTNRVAFDVAVIYQEIEDRNETVENLTRMLGTKRAKIEKRIENARGNPFIPVRIAGDIEKEKAIRIEESMIDLPGVIVTTRPLRKYNHGKILSHVTGYLGRISEKELKKYKTYGYQVEDFVGKDGIERSYNDYLRGVDGGLQVEVDSKGRRRRVLAVKQPRMGRDLHLNIDIELQGFCDTLLAEKRGAILAMDPKTGEVLALVSHDNYDPNAFVSARWGNISGILNDREGFPLLDRAISGTYPTGSVFKIVIALTALDSGAFDTLRSFQCVGSLRIGDRVFNCWEDKGHGPQILMQAVKNSCNVFFYQLGLDVGAERISKYAFKCGFGQPTGIDLPGELNGLVPTPSWKRKKYGEPWFKGETANYSIGQGYLLATPVQVLCLVASVANEGRLVSPSVAGRIGDIELRQREPRDIGINPEAIETVKQSLRDVVNAHRGTGVYARSQEVVISGKTGTAQNPSGPTHAWFAGFAPYDNPGICVVVFLEHGGKGGLGPAKFAKEIIEEAKRLELL